MTQIPDRWYAGHLRWTRSGQVIATWRVTAPLKRSTNVIDAQRNRVIHHQVLAALVGHDALINGTLTWTDPGHVIDKMVDGLDLTQCSAYAAECEARLDDIAGLPLGVRRYWVSVTLKSRLSRSAREAFNWIADELDLAALRPGDAEIAACLDEAERIETNWPADLQFKRATEAELVWMWRNAQTRSASLVDPVEDRDLAVSLLQPFSGRAAVGNPVLDPNGLSELEGPARRLAPVTRRFVGVWDDSGAEPSWQSGIVVCAAPRGKVDEDLHYSRAEILGRIDDTGISADWAIRLTTHSRAVAARANKKAMRGLVDQLDQTSEAGVNHTGRLLKLDEAAETLSDYNAEIELDDKAIETRPLILMSTSAPDGPTASDQARQILNSPVMENFTLARPVGAEESIFWSMQPGARIPLQLTDRRQIATGRDLAALAPFTSTELGHDRGHLAGLITTTPLLQPWYLDLFGRVKANESPTLIATGRQGSGKSAFLKTLAGSIVDRGGRFVSVDASTDGEWLRFAAALGDELSAYAPTCVDAANPTCSLDLLAAGLPPTTVSPLLRAFLGTLFNVSATSKPGLLLGKVLRSDSIAENNLTSTARLHTYLARECRLAGAAEIADLMDGYADPDTIGSLASVMFDSSLPPADLSAKAIVFGTSNVGLPTESELTNPHLYNTLSPAKIFGRALYTYLAMVAKMICFADRAEQAAFIVDEAHHVTKPSPESSEVCMDFVRYGRRENSALLLGSHDPIGDVPDETMRGLISNRVCMRQTDERLAARQAQFLGFDEDKHPGEFAEVVQTTLNFPENSGAGYYRDGQRRIGTVQTLLPARPNRREAVLSTPPDRSAVG